MSTIFYDKDDIKFDRRLHDLNQRLNEIQTSYPYESEYIRKGWKVFHNYNKEVHQRMAGLLTNEVRWADWGRVIGAGIVFAATWELVQGVQSLLRWIGKRMAQSKDVDINSKMSKRFHAREWKKNP